MLHHIKITQVFRVEKSTVIAVEAASLTDAIEAISSGEVDLPSASDDVGNVWIVERYSLEDEDYRTA